MAHALSVSAHRSDHLSPFALALAVLLHAAVAAALWWMMVNRPFLPPAEEPVETVVTKDTSQYSEQPAPVDENSKAEQETENTGSIQSASSGAAIVLNPGIEVTEDPAPVEAVPAEPAGQSDD